MGNSAAKRETSSGDPQAGGWSTSRRLVVSVVLWLHLIAVFAGPWSQPPPASDLARAVAACFDPYLKFMSLDNGYRFFAPDPGPSHLVRWEVTTNSGEIVRGEFPRRGDIWPRLLYHRHFMISEMLFSMAAPTMELPPPHLLTDEDRQQIQEQREISTELQESLARYLLRQHNGRSVKLTAVSHGMPTPMDVQRGMRLEDPTLYQEMPLGEFAEADL